MTAERGSMTVTMSVNGKPITYEELCKLELNNDVMQSVINQVRARLRDEKQKKFST